MDLIKTGIKTAESILDMTGSVLDACGGRAPGSQGSLCAADRLYEVLSGFCSEVHKETFAMHPGSQFAIGKAVGIAYVLSAALMTLGGAFNYIAAVLCAAAFAYALIHYFLYGNAFDCFFKEKAGCNVVGVLEPSGPVTKQIIVSGHHDSAYTFSFFSRLEKLAGLRLILGMLFYIYLMAVSIVFCVITAGGGEPRLEGALLILALFGLLFAAPLFFFISGQVSPGASDNLNGSSMAIHILKYFAQGRTLNNTRLIALSTDGEEAGQRGAKAYVKRHIKELKSIPTYVINIDSVYKKEELAVMTRDRHGIVPLSNELAGMCIDTASRLGCRVKKIAFPFGSGTDAAAFAKAGVEAATIIAMSTSLFEKGHIYHSLSDTVENIEPEAVEAVMDITLNTIVKLDSQ